MPAPPGPGLTVTTPAEASAPPVAVDRSLDLMGTHVRIVIEGTGPVEIDAPEAVADHVVAFLRDYDRRLSRFRDDSELAKLNRDPRPVVPASALLRAAVSAALQAAERSDGLLDPTVLDGLEASGYVTSWDPRRRLDLRTALDRADGPRHPATADPARRWTRIAVDDVAGTIARTPGLRLDTGATGKGHAADLAAALLRPYDAWALDVGGDLRIGGRLGLLRAVEIERPFTGEHDELVRLRSGAIATSGLRSRIWAAPDGSVAHHLLDPSTGRPAFTGIVAATAVAPTTVEAETRATAALLAGPLRAWALLARHGGAFFDEHGTIVRVGRPEAAPRVRIAASGTVPGAPRPS